MCIGILFQSLYIVGLLKLYSTSTTQTACAASSKIIFFYCNAITGSILSQWKAYFSFKCGNQFWWIIFMRNFWLEMFWWGCKQTCQPSGDFWRHQSVQWDQTNNKCLDTAGHLYDMKTYRKYIHERATGIFRWIFSLRFRVVTTLYWATPFWRPMIRNNPVAFHNLGPFLLTWFNVNLSMDK